MSTAIAEQEAGFAPTEYLRSVNLEYDVESPNRIAHFRPTSKSIPLIRQLTLERTSDNYLVVAPYGSGKSLLATYVAQVVENRQPGTDVLRDIAARLSDAAPDLHELLHDRLDDNQLVRPSGIAVLLHGYQPNLARALARAIRASFSRLGLEVEVPFGDRTTPDLLPDVLQWLADSKDVIRSASARNNGEAQRLVILWDEFGRHLEELVADGNAAQLSDIQLLAEMAARQRAMPFSVAVFLHQSLSNYASGLSQTIRKEWKKIEGRFETVQYVDDSAEVTSLIADIIASMRPQELKPDEATINSHLTEIDSAGLFRDIPAASLSGILAKAYPVEPTTLYLLPRVSARVAQNERTLFSFLFAVHLGDPVTPEHLYDYFANAMRSDTGIGGTYHQWLETQNGLEKCTDDLSRLIVKTAGLLGLGVSGHRSRVAKRLLCVACAGYRRSTKETDRAVRKLIDQKLLLYRRSSDQVSIWHGVDIDLRGRLQNEKDRYGLGFDAIEYVRTELPPTSWLPTEYNADYRITRYFRSEYVAASRLIATIEEVQPSLVNGALDGYILHVIPDDNDEPGALTEQVAGMSVPAGIVVTIPRRPESFSETALEVFALRRMQDDDALVGEDPLVLPELRQMTDDTLEYLRRALSRLADPNPEGPMWFTSDGAERVESAADLRHLLSEICRRVYPKTPVINNELIVRRRPRQVFVNARKKLLAAVLERYGSEDLGIEGFRPDRSMFNTVLLQTGLYRRQGGAWSFASPGEVSDPRLRHVWRRFQRLMTEPSKRAKDLASFYASLRQAPIGLRDGLYPILTAAAMRAFPAALSITRNGVYVEDVLPSVVEAICEVPEEFELTVLPMTPEMIEYLSAIREIFDEGDRPTAETDLLRSAYDSVQRWRARLAPGALTTRRVSKEAARLRTLVERVTDPVDLFMRKLPTTFEIRDLGDRAALDPLRSAIDELNGVVGLYFDFAESALRDALELRSGRDTTEDARRWTSLIPEGAAAQMTNSLARALHQRLSMTYDTPRRLLDSLSSLLLDKTIARWDDSSLSAFDIALRSAVRQIEEVALESARTTGEHAEEMIQLAETRMRNLFRYLDAIAGNQRAASIMNRIIAQEASE